MNWKTLPEAPESVKYHGGYDPADPPKDEESELMMCDCGHEDYEEETTTLEDGSVICVNCLDEYVIRAINADSEGFISHEETGGTL